jgi:hypothetical protein
MSARVRALWLFAVVPLALASRVAYADEPSTEAINAQDRVPLAFLLNTPTGEVANTSSSEIIRIVSNYLGGHTNFFLQVADPNLATDCRGRVSCLVLAVRSDYNRMALIREEGGVVPYKEHLADLARKKQQHARYLLVLANVTAEGQADRLSAVLVDTDIALDRYHAASRQSEAWEKEVEAGINESAVLAGPTRGELRSPAEAKTFLELFISRECSRVFESSDNWEPYGTLLLNTPHAGVGITLDGVALGTTRAGQTTVANVTPGTRKLTLEHPDFKTYSAEVSVERHKTSNVDLDLQRSASAGAPLARRVVTWSGAGVAAVGAAVLALAIARQRSDLTTGCFLMPGSPCRTTSQFQTLNYDSSRTTGDLNPSGIMTAPLGYSMIATGGVWSLGTLLAGDDADFPWIQFIAGLGVGIATYAISAVANGSSPASK